jgi:hypothetical protein
MTYFIDDHKPRSRASNAGEKREYFAYFALIFVATLPLACLTWVLSFVRRMELPASGPIKSAWSQAQIITPRIFSA